MGDCAEWAIATFLLCHRHEAKECAIVFASWSGFDSPLRHRPTVGTCPTGGHALWWQVEAEGVGAALAHLPQYVADRTEAVPVVPVAIP